MTIRARRARHGTRGVVASSDQPPAPWVSNVVRIHASGRRWSRPDQRPKAGVVHVGRIGMHAARRLLRLSEVLHLGASRRTELARRPTRSAELARHPGAGPTSWRRRWHVTHESLARVAGATACNPLRPFLHPSAERSTAAIFASGVGSGSRRLARQGGSDQSSTMRAWETRFCQWPLL